MGISKTTRLNIILLAAGYLFVVLNHLYFTEGYKHHPALTGNGKNITIVKAGDKTNRYAYAPKKISKTIVNRDVSEKKAKAPYDLHVATLLFDGSVIIEADDITSSYNTSFTDLPVRKFYHLRI